jgi:hypothetical protein
MLDALSLREIKPQWRGRWLIRVTLSQLATIPFIVAGVVLLTRGGIGTYWLVPGVIFCFLVAFFDAWVLLIEINR